MAKDKTKAWYDDIDTATLQRIKTYSAFNDAESKNLMMQTMYEYREKEIKDFKETNHELAETCIARKKRIAELEKENTLVKSLLYGTQRTCDNCGFVNCENFQRQRKSEPCSLYIPYQVRIKNLAHESDVLRESYNNSAMNLASVSEQLVKAKKIIGNLYAICKDNHYSNISVLMEQAEQFLSEVEHD